MNQAALTTDQLIEFLKTFPAGTKVNIYFGKGVDASKIVMADLQDGKATITAESLFEDLTWSTL